MDFRCDVTILSSLLIKTYCRILVLASFFLVRLEKLVNIHRLSKSDLLCCVKLTLFQLKYTTLNEAGQGKCVQCIPIYYISQWLDSYPWEDPPSSKILVCPQSKLQVLKQVQNRLKKTLFFNSSMWCYSFKRNSYTCMYNTESRFPKALLLKLQEETENICKPYPYSR